MSISSKSLSTDDYDAAEAWCVEVIRAGHALLFSPSVFLDEMEEAANKFHMPVESLHSFFRSIHLIHVKKNSYRVLRNNVKRHVEDYVSGNMSILDMARAMNYPPYHVARLIVDHVANLNGGSSGSGGGGSGGNNNKKAAKAVTEAMREPWRVLGDAKVVKPEYRSSESHKSSSSSSSSPPSSAALSRLACEVIEAMNADPLYGPKQDRERHLVGLEHEDMLEKALKSMNIPFETENDLRIKGTARTPDVLLSCPVGMKVPKKRSRADYDDGYDEDGEEEWKVVCWIDSKALFGDVKTHNESVLPQAESFVHRFGPGLILYWFGHAPIERLGDGHGDVLVTGWNLPEEFMLPTGEIATAMRSCSDFVSPDN